MTETFPVPRQDGRLNFTYDVREDPCNTPVDNLPDGWRNHARTPAIVGLVVVRFDRDMYADMRAVWSLACVDLEWRAVDDPTIARHECVRGEECDLSDAGRRPRWVHTTTIDAPSMWTTREAPDWVRKYVAASVIPGEDPVELYCSPWNGSCAVDCDKHTDRERAMYHGALQETVNGSRHAHEADAWLKEYAKRREAT